MTPGMEPNIIYGMTITGHQKYLYIISPLHK